MCVIRTETPFKTKSKTTEKLDVKSLNEMKKFAAGTTIFEEGSLGRELYLVESGEVEIVKETSVGRVVLAQFKKGDFFGEMALLQSQPRYATAIAKVDTQLQIVQPGGFLLKIRRDPTLAFEMLQQLSMRLKTTNERLIEYLVEKGKYPSD